MNNPRFRLGQIVATPGALEALTKAGQTAWSLLARHLSGDWGECDPHDRQANEDALVNGGRIFSVYRLNTGEKLWLITEADRSSSCLLTPDEY